MKSSLGAQNIPRGPQGVTKEGPRVPKGVPKVQNEAWGRLWGGFGKALGDFGKALGGFGRLWEGLELDLGALVLRLGALGCHVEALGLHLGRCWGPRGSSWALLGLHFGPAEGQSLYINKCNLPINRGTRTPYYGSKCVLYMNIHVYLYIHISN